MIGFPMAQCKGTPSMSLDSLDPKEEIHVWEKDTSTGSIGD
jgi:hypothetical protein